MNKSVIPFLVVTLGAVLLFIFLLSSSGSTSDNADTAAEDSVETTDNINSTDDEDMDVQDFDAFKIDVTKEGEGAAAKEGDTVTVHYTGTLSDGTKFDSSVDRGEPFSFTLGEGRVIQGWEEGLLGAQAGQEMTLTIPSDMGYGEFGSPPVIPPSAGLIFEIEVIGIE